MKQVIIEQGTDEWSKLRSSRLGASDVAAIMGLSPYMTRSQLFMIKTDQIPQAPMNSNMSFGHQMEPLLRDLAGELFDDIFTPRVMLHPEHDFLMASLDGLNFEETTVLEIKTCKKSVFEEVLHDSIVPYYLVQVQLQLAVTPCAGEAIFFCYWPGPRGDNRPYYEKVAWTKVKPDLGMQEKIIEECTKFWDEVQQFNLSAGAGIVS